MNINGKEVHTRYGMLATDYFLSKFQLLEGLSYYSTIGIAHMIWGGVLNYYEVKQLPLPVSFEHVYDLVEDCMIKADLTDIQSEIDAFKSSQALSSKTEQINKALDEVKKKMSQTKEES